MPFPNLEGRPPLFETIEKLEALIEGYFESCFGIDANGNKFQIRPITIEGLAYDLDCDRRTIHNYKERKDIQGKDFYPIIKKAINRCQVSLVELALTARNPAGAIWLGCNNYDYVNKTDVHVIAEPEKIDASEIKKLLQDRHNNNVPLIEESI